MKTPLWLVCRCEEAGLRWILAFAGMTEERRSGQGNLESIHSRFDRLDELRGETEEVLEPAVPEPVEGRKAGGGGQRGSAVVPLGFVSTIRSFDTLRTAQAQRTGP